MAKLKALEKAVYIQVWNTPFTRVPGHPTWIHTEHLVKDVEVTGIEMDVSYAWAGDWCLLSEIHGTVKYLASNREAYMPPPSPPQNYTGVLLGNPSQTHIQITTASNNLLKQGYHTLLAFCTGIGQNLRDMLDSSTGSNLKSPSSSGNRSVHGTT